MPAYKFIQSRTKVPIFPDECIGCGCDHPRYLVRISTNLTTRWWTLLGGVQYWVDVPACWKCRCWIRFADWGGNIAGIGVGLTVLWRFHAALSGFFPGKLAVLPCTAIAIVVTVLWRALVPEPLDIIVSDDLVQFSFRDEDYKNRFALLNLGLDMQDD